MGYIFRYYKLYNRYGRNMGNENEIAGYFQAIQNENEIAALEMKLKLKLQK